MLDCFRQPLCLKRVVGGKEPKGHGIAKGQARGYRAHACRRGLDPPARKTGIARGTAATCAARDDCSPTAPARRTYSSPRMEPFAGIAAAWLAQDEDRPRSRAIRRSGCSTACRRMRIRRLGFHCRAVRAPLARLAPAGPGRGLRRASMAGRGLPERISDTPRQSSPGNTETCCWSFMACLQRPVLLGLPIAQVRMPVRGPDDGLRAHGPGAGQRRSWQARPRPDARLPARSANWRSSRPSASIA